MFSGIIDAIGTIKSVDNRPDRTVLSISADGYWADLTTGASVAIDGVCLTLTHANESTAQFDVIAETLRLTTLGDLRAGQRVNLQKSLRVGDRVDGHFVQGHVDGTAEVESVESTSRESKWWFAPHHGLMHFIVPKGSITIDGISLTIVDVKADRFSVALIPTTLERTTLGTKQRGARVNIETDILARTIVHHLRGILPSVGKH
jgi:riboflavin synthase alpha subunit